MDSTVEVVVADEPIDELNPYKDIAFKRRRTTNRFVLRVRCGGQYHTVSWQPRGRITIHDHTKEELRSLKTLQTLGDRSCQCLEVIRKFRADRRDSYVMSKQAWKVPIRAAHLAVQLRRERKMRDGTPRYYRRVEGSTRVYQQDWAQALGGKWHRIFQDRADEARRVFVAEIMRMHSARISGYGAVQIATDNASQGATLAWSQGEGVVHVALKRDWLRLHGLGLALVQAGPTKLFGLRLLSIKGHEALLDVIVPEKVNGSPIITKRTIRAHRRDVLGHSQVWDAVECLTRGVDVESPFGLSYSELMPVS